MKNYTVSILIRTRDIETHLQELLWRLSHQTLPPSELVIVDNFSSKKKLEDMHSLLKWTKKKFFDGKIYVKLVPIRDEEFSHSYSTNVGVSVAIGNLICITNGHSLPFSNTWLESGVTHFKSQKVAGVGGYFIPHKNGTVWEKLVYNWWKRLNEISKAYIKDDYFSTINCIIRKSLWEKYPFDEELPREIPHARKFGGEDYDWAIEMLARGYRIVVEPRFNVCHSHQETLEQLIPKYFVWRQIRKKIRVFKRPRESYTSLKRVKSLYYNV
jgi:glycosyltransferase involved in cell wall biosynthesis